MTSMFLLLLNSQYICRGRRGIVICKIGLSLGLAVNLRSILKIIVSYITLLLADSALAYGWQRITQLDTITN